MKGLLYKDFAQMLSNRRLYLYVGILCGINSLLYLTGRGQFTGGYMLQLILPVYLIYCVLYTIGTDRRAQWTRYITAAPIPRRWYVQSKYLTLLAMSLGCLVIVSAYISLEFLLAGAPGLIVGGLANAALHILSMALASAIFYPFYFWLESELADNIMGILVLAPLTLLFVIRSGLLPSLKAILAAFDAIRLPLLAAGLALAIIGYFISQALWRRKEL